MGSRLVKIVSSTIQPRVKACMVDTRRAPVHPWPAPLEDAMASYRWLRKVGYSASQIVLAGDSAGGGLCLCLLIALRDAMEDLPLCAMVVSPFTDLARTEDQYSKQLETKTDFIPPIAIARATQYYTQGLDPKHPLKSPKYGELHALPPVLIQAGENETLARDSIEFAQRLLVYGGQVQLEMYPDMPHIFPMFAALGLNDAHTAIQRQAKFLRKMVKREQPKSCLSILKHDRRTRSFDLMPSTFEQSKKPVHASTPSLHSS